MFFPVREAGAVMCCQKDVFQQAAPLDVYLPAIVLWRFEM